MATPAPPRPIANGPVSGGPSTPRPRDWSRTSEPGAAFSGIGRGRRGSGGRAGEAGEVVDVEEEGAEVVLPSQQILQLTLARRPHRRRLSRRSPPRRTYSNPENNLQHRRL